MALTPIGTAENAVLSLDIVSGNVVAIELLCPGPKSAFVEVVNPGGNVVLTRTFAPQAAVYRTNVPNNRRAPWEQESNGWTVRLGTV